MLIIITRTLVAAISIRLWHFTQQFLGRRATLSKSNNSTATIHDVLHWSTSWLHARIINRPNLANGLLACSSAIVDVLTLLLFGLAIFGPTFEPVVGMILLFTLRQFAQFLCELRPPEGIIWRDPGIPSLFVTYDVKNDLFFSGHTAFAVYAAFIIHSVLGNSIGVVLGLALVLFQVATVLILRIHYTMDVFTGIFCALYIYEIGHRLSPQIDELFYSMTRTAAY